MTGRHNEYFIPGEGISREVIQADICRYLGNDALVKPGTHQGRSGYLIRAYRNLTTEMINDLKADSARWEQEVERRANLGYSRGTYVSPSHELRSQGGPSSPPYPAAPAPYADPYAQPAPYGAPNQSYSGQSYPTSQSPGYNPNPYAAPPQQHPYSGPGQGQSIPVSDVHQPSYTYTGNPNYGYERGNAAPRYSGAGYENEPEYSPVTSGMGYPPATAPSDARLGMDSRFGPESYPDHRTGTGRPQQSRAPHRGPR